MLDGKKLDSIPDESLLMYELCKTFHKLPSEINSEDYEEMANLVIVHNAINTKQAKDDKKQQKKAGRDKSNQ
jgi:hypothetical protein